MAKKELSDLLIGHKLTSEESSGGPTPPTGEPGAKQNKSVLPILLSLVALVLGAVLAYFIWQQTEQLKGIQAHGQKLDQALELIVLRLDGNNDQLATLQSQIRVTMNRVGVTQKEQQRARRMALKLREEQVHNVEVLTREIEAKANADEVALLEKTSGKRFDGVDHAITSVKEDVKSTRQDLLDTMAELATLGVKVNEQGQMIATNESGVEELRKRGERDYVEFSLRKKRKARVAGITLELRDTDLGDHPDADLRIYANDSMMERKDVPLNTPVNFYVGTENTPYELVVNQILDRSCTGYISAPKGKLPQGPPSLSLR